MFPNPGPCTLYFNIFYIPARASEIACIIKWKNDETCNMAMGGLPNPGKTQWYCPGTAMIGDEVQVCVLPVDSIEPLNVTVRSAMFAWYALLFRSAINL